MTRGHGAEAWKLNEEVHKVLNGVNNQMLSIMTGKPIQDEARAETKTFNMLDAVRATRLRWAGHILHMKQKTVHPPSLVQQALHHIYDNRSEVDLLMGAPVTETWEELQELTEDRIDWRDRVNKIKVYRGDEEQEEQEQEQRQQKDEKEKEQEVRKREAQGGRREGVNERGKQGRRRRR